MDAKGKTYLEADLDANNYAARCLYIAAGIVVLVWVLNLTGFFVVDAFIMNLTAPIALFSLLSPTIMLKVFHIHGPWMKYYILICFVVGISILHIGMTYQVILPWACPILLSCHFYSKRVTTVTYLSCLLLLFITIFMGAIYGTWDCNMMDATRIDGDASVRIAYLINQHQSGEDTLINILKLYYLSRALILSVVYVIGTTLSNRTNRLLEKQEADFLEKERIRTELSVASEIQNAMLPNIFPAFPEKQEFELYASMTPSKEVGGDFYDFFFIDEDHLALVIADVSGKGVPAAMFMMSTQIMIKNLASVEKSPAQLLMEVNDQICESNQSDMFVTVWFGIYELSTGSIRASNAGHEYPLLGKNKEDFALIKDKHGLVLGGMEGIKYRDYELQLDIGDTLFVYTDGVLEAIDEETTAYGTERLLGQLNSTKEAPLSHMLAGVKNSVDAFANTAEQFDDITMLSIRRNK